MGFLSDLFGGADRPDISQLIEDGALLIDTRTPQEFAGGTIEGSINIPHDIIGLKISEHIKDLNQSIVVYCQAGMRAHAAATVLKKAGFTSVANGGGIDALRRKLQK